ncbi:MAG: carbohydrate porin [Gammaproteobacteria bacterium]|nr:carbohydrate porin [Gammaproteobacteria bacterium]
MKRPFNNQVGLFALGFALLYSAPCLSTDELSDYRVFGGPDAVEIQIAEDAQSITALVKERVLDPWFEWKASVQKDTGFNYGIDYIGLALSASDSPGKSNASSGVARFYGSWDLIGRGTKNSGALVWKVEHRHRYGEIAPNGFGLGELGYVGLIGGPYSNQGTRLTNLYWRQRFNDGKATLVGGYLDVTDYVDTFGGGSPWTGFANLAFSTGSASMFLPNDATLGIVAAGMLRDNLYAIGGVTNTYADPTDPFKDSFDRFFNDGEHFMTLELGWTRSQERIFLDNTHVTFWRVDDSVQAGTQEGWGVAFSHVRYLDEKWMPFIRGGYTEDGGSLLQKSLSSGLLYQRNPGADLVGVGLNWGQPNETTFGSGLDDQYTVEAFYRIPVTQQLAITPSVEYIKNPALNPEDDSLWVFGVRARLAL